MGPRSRPDVWETTPIRGPWSSDEVRRHLERSLVPLRLACMGKRGPWVVSLWFLAEHDGLWLATQRESFVARSLIARPGCGFEVAADAPPYRGVRGTGQAEVDAGRGERLIGQLMRRYGVAPDSRLATFLRARAHSELAFRIRPERAVSWDFSERMSGAFSASSR